MASDEHLSRPLQGVVVWNDWRRCNPDIRADLSQADLSTADLRGANLSWAYLDGANLGGADLKKADLSRANLTAACLRKADLRGANLLVANLGRADLTAANFRGADLTSALLDKANLSAAHLNGANLTAADLSEADLSVADLSEADLRGANLSWASLSGANLSSANLQEAIVEYTNLSHADFTDADLTGCHIYGVSVWGLKLSEATKQRNLIISSPDQPEITVDNIEVAQFVYLLLHNAKIRNVIDTVTSKVVLILGRFTDGRKMVLDALRDELRKRDYLPILFDFDKPTSRTTDETITLLAGMARFVIADISDAKSVLQELRAIVPELPSVPHRQERGMASVEVKHPRFFLGFDNHWLHKKFEIGV
jgi:uncharacterized protein YjbI with pentapeptide repeats